MGLKKVRSVLAGTALLALVAPAAAQDSAPIKPPMPRAAEYLQVVTWPDFTGIWYPDWAALFSERSGPPKLTAAAQAKLDAWNEKYKDTGPPLYAQARCLPPGIPGVFQQPYPIEILYSPGQVTILTEAYEQAVRIYMDGRALPEDPDLFFNGTTVGHWDGDTLVFKSVGFSPLTTIGPGIGHSDKLTIDGTIAMRDAEVMVLTMTLTDPETLAQPYVTKVAYKRDEKFPIREWVCAENNRLTSDDETGANIDLKLDGEDDPFANLDD